MATRPKQNPYSVHPGVAMVQKWIADLEAKTGRAFADWLTFVRAEGPGDEKAAAAWLKEKHGLGTFVAKWLAERAHQKETGLADESPERYLERAPTYVDRQFQGKKASLRPIYDALLAKALKLGKDAKACPCETIVPLYREHVFAQLKATTNTRFDLGLALKAYEGKLPARLVDTGGLAKKDRITHRIELTSPDEIDAFVDRWLKIAYDLDAPQFPPDRGRPRPPRRTDADSPATPMTGRTLPPAAPPPPSERSVAEGPQHRVHARLVTAPLRAEPVQHVAVDAQRDRRLRDDGPEAPPHDPAHDAPHVRFRMVGVDDRLGAAEAVPVGRRRRRRRSALRGRSLCGTR